MILKVQILKPHVYASTNTHIEWKTFTSTQLFVHAQSCEFSLSASCSPQPQFWGYTVSVCFYILIAIHMLSCHLDSVSHTGMTFNGLLENPSRPLAFPVIHSLILVLRGSFVLYVSLVSTAVSTLIRHSITQSRLWVVLPSNTVFSNNSI